MAGKAVGWGDTPTWRSSGRANAFYSHWACLCWQWAHAGGIAGPKGASAHPEPLAMPACFSPPSHLLPVPSLKHKIPKTLDYHLNPFANSSKEFS